MVITIQVIRCNIHQHSDIGLEIIHAVKLETAQLYYIPVTIFRCNSQRKALPNITGQPHIHIGLPQHFVSEGRGGRLAIAAGNTDCFRSIQITTCKLNLRNNRNTLGAQCFDNRCRFGNTRAFDHLIRSKD